MRKKIKHHKPIADITVLRGNSVKQLKVPYTPEQARKFRDDNNS